MTPEQITLVQTSFTQVSPIADEAAALFYDRLFALDPALRALFKGDMKAQGRALMSMIRVAVNGLSHLEQIVPAVQDLGRRHGTYGVTDQDYDTVAAALLRTLERGLGVSFTPDVKLAWTEAYLLLAGTMKAAAASVSASAAAPAN